MLVSVFFIRDDLNGDLADEDVRFAAYLASKGWTGTSKFCDPYASFNRLASLIVLRLFLGLVGTDGTEGLITAGKAAAEVEAVEHDVKNSAQ